MTKNKLMRHIDRAAMLLSCLAMLCLPGCATTKTVYVPQPCRPPDSLLQQPESTPYLKRLRQLLTPAPETQPDSKTPLIGPRS